MTASLCSVADCPRIATSRGWCRGHYYRWYRHGDLQVHIPLPAKIAVACEAEGCDEERLANGLCNMHSIRMRNHGSLELPEPTVYSGDEHPAWKGKAVTYGPAHTRVVRDRGSASTHLCWNCGSQAQDWAYDHNDADELTCQKSGRTYSADPDHYLPLCRPCHKRIDNAARRGDLECVREVMSS